MHLKQSGMCNGLTVLATSSVVVTALVALAAAGGCSSSDDGALPGGQTGGTASASGGSSNAGTSSNTGGGTMQVFPDPAGTFSVTLTPANTVTGTQANARLLGAVRAAPQTATKFFKVVEDNGTCQLQQAIVPFCDPACGSADICVPNTPGSTDGHCFTQPAVHSVGTLTVEGVKTQANLTSFTLDPLSSLAYNKADLLYPPFAEGDVVKLTAAGGDYSAFTVTAKGISPIQTSLTVVTVTKDQPIDLTWTAAGASADSRVEVALDISQHGTTKGQIICNAPDTGSLQIPASMVTKLIGYGVAGFPTIAITRKARGSADIAPGRVDLLLISTIELEVVVPGYTSCKSVDDPCPSGQTCSVEVLLCVAG